jgi:hypothetical protein
MMVRAIFIAMLGALALALSAAHAAMDVRHSEGVEIIIGRRTMATPPPSRAAGITASGPGNAARTAAPQSSPASTRTDPPRDSVAETAPARPQPDGDRAENGRLDDRLPARDNVSILPDTAGETGDDGRPKDGAAPVRKRLRVTEAVLQDQIAAYNRALLGASPPETLAPLEEAISRTLDQIDVLVRNTRVPQP